MDNFKEGSRIALRVITTVGVLSIEQLWSLKEATLIELEEKLTDAVEKGKVGSSRRRKTTKSSEQYKNELTLAIVSDILDTKEKESQEERAAKDKKENNQKILALIQEKKEGALKEKTVEELEALLIS